MKILDYTIRDSSKNTVNTPSISSEDNPAIYVTKEEMSGVYDEIKALREKVDGLVKRRRREAGEDE